MWNFDGDWVFTLFWVCLGWSRAGVQILAPSGAALSCDLLLAYITCPVSAPLKYIPVALTFGLSLPSSLLRTDTTHSAFEHYHAKHTVG